MTPLRTQLEKSLGWILVALLLGGCLMVMLPFVTALLWGSVLIIGSWPLYHWLVRWPGGRRTLAALLMALAMIFVILTPLVVAVDAPAGSLSA